MSWFVYYSTIYKGQDYIFPFKNLRRKFKKTHTYADFTTKLVRVAVRDDIQTLLDPQNSDQFNWVKNRTLVFSVLLLYFGWSSFFVCF